MTKAPKASATGTTAPRGAKLAEIVAARIEADIVSSGWPVGTVVGSEAELLERYGVSRAVLREALRIVEHHFVATMRRGPGGGLVVTEPDVTAVVRALTLQLEYEDIAPHHLHEARAILERTCIRLAADRLTRKEVDQLRDQMQIDRTAPGRHQNFHVWIAQLTGNPALTLFVSVLGMVIRDHLALPPTSEKVTAELNAAHRAIAEALVDQDAARAEELMDRHLDTVKEWLEPPGQRRRATPRRRRPQRRPRE